MSWIEREKVSLQFFMSIRIRKAEKYLYNFYVYPYPNISELQKSISGFHESQKNLEKLARHQQEAPPLRLWRWFSGVDSSDQTYTTG